MAVIDATIKSGVTQAIIPLVVRGSDGTLFSIYDISGSMKVAYSINSGQTWSEVDAGVTVSGASKAVAIDSLDVLHVVYRKNSDSKPYYKQYTISGGWTTEEAIDTVTTMNYGMSVAVDSVDDVHVAWVISGNATSISYNKRTSGTWGTPTLFQQNTGAAQYIPKIVIDSSNNIVIIWGLYAVGAGIYMVEYSGGGWGSVIGINASAVHTTNRGCGIIIDSSNNLNIVYITTGLNLIYRKRISGIWQTEVSLGNSEPPTYGPFISIDTSNNLTVLYSNSNDIYIYRYTGSWGSETKILDATTPNGFQYPSSKTPIFPIIGGVSTNIPTAGYSFNYSINIGTVLRYYASSDLNFPAPVNENYSREAVGSLPSTDANLDNLFISSEYSNVATEDAVFTTQSATNEYSVILFKNKGLYVTDNIVVTWIGQSNIAPSASTVYLQIYNRTSGLWETLDSDNATGVDTNFTLSGTKTSSLTDYYDANLWVSCRVYQLAS